MVDAKLKYAIQADVQQMRSALVSVGADVTELTRKLKEQAKTGTAGSTEMIAEVRRLREVMRGINSDVRTEMSQAAGNVGAMRNQIQNAAFQFGDFAVQVASGTSASRAFAQQAPQLLGAFGMWGAIVGAAAAALVPLIGNLISTADEGDEAAERLQGLITALQSFREYSELAGTSVEDLKTKFGRFAGQMREDAQWMARISLGEARAALRENTAGIALALTEVVAKYSELEEAASVYSQMAANGMSMDSPAMGSQIAEIARLKAEADELASTIGLTATQAMVLQGALKNLENAEGMSDVADAAQAAKTALIGMFPEGAGIPAAVADIVKGLDLVLQEAAQGVVAFDQVGKSVGDLSGPLTKAGDLVRQLSMGVPTSNWLDPAIAGANQLAGALRAANGAKSALSFGAGVSVPSDPFMPKGAAADDFRARTERTAKAEAANDAWIKYQYQQYGYGRTVDVDMPADTGSGGGGGGGAVSEMDRLRQSATAAMASVSTAQGEIAEKVKAGLMTTGEGVKALRDAKVAAANDLAELAAAFEAQGTDAGRGMAAQLRSEIETVTQDIGGMFDELADKMSASFTDPFADFLVGAKSAKEALSDFGQSIVKIFANAAAQSVTTNLMQPLMSGLLSGFGFAQGGVIPFAKGGLPGINAYEGQIVDRPTLFAMGGGETGLMGEAGAEAIMPLTRMADGTLGVRAQPNPLVQWAKENAHRFGPPDIMPRRSALSVAEASAAKMQVQGGMSQVVNIQTAPGMEATAQTRQDGSAQNVDVVFKQVDNSLARGVMRGDSALANALAQSFGLNRKPK